MGPWFESLIPFIAGGALVWVFGRLFSDPVSSRPDNGYLRCDCGAADTCPQGRIGSFDRCVILKHDVIGSARSPREALLPPMRTDVGL